MASTVFKLKTYQKESISGNYYFSHWWSAVQIDDTHIITNAHVILDADGKEPTGLYEVCKNIAGKSEPVCFDTAKLKSYDTITDLALLELSSKHTIPEKLTFSKNNLSIGSTVIVYGYPAIWWSNITRTEGKIGGMEGENYKFDGTIDHGNSGGWAFDANGKLVWLPYAVSSDNGVIGYIIPSSIIQSFLWWESYDLRKYSSSKEKAFVKYIKNIQNSTKNISQAKIKRFDAQSLEKAWFILQSIVESNDGKIYDYRFLDKNERVAVIVGCSKDTSLKYTALDIANLPDNKENFDQSVTSTGYYIWKEKRVFLNLLTYEPNTKWEQLVLAGIQYKDAPTCASVIVANDGIKTDKILFQKAQDIAVKLRFVKPPELQKKLISPFFQLQNLPENVYISEGTTFLSTQILPTIQVILDNWSLTTSSTLEIYSFSKRNEYMDIWYWYSQKYKGSTYTFNSFYDRYKTSGSSTVRDSIIETKSWDKLIITEINLSEDAQEKTKVLVFYPFKTQDGKYKAYQFVFEYTARNVQYLQELIEIIKTIDFPGSSPFDN